VRPIEDLVLLGDNLELLPQFEDGFFQLAYLDPPFNTGRRQSRRTVATVGDPVGDRTGFQGRRYSTRVLRESAYDDEFDDYIGFLEPRLEEVRRLLAPSGTLYLHVDYREAHYVKVLLDRLFGRECFLNEIIWAYDYGARPRRRWPAKHDTILVYVKDPKGYWFDAEAVEREPSRARHRREGRPRQAAHRRLVAHDRLADGEGEDRLSHPEAGRSDPSHRPGVQPPRRLVPRLLRRLGHACSRRRCARSALRPH
jgi:DNA modification methylase